MKKFLVILSICFVLATPVFAQYGLDETAGAANLKGESEPTVILGKIIGAGLSLIGIVFFILTLYAGIVWMVARGNEDSAKKAINTIIAAAIGMIITMSAYAITSFILDAANQSALGSGGGSEQRTVPEPDPTLDISCTTDSECADTQLVCSGGSCLDKCHTEYEGYCELASGCVEASGFSSVTNRGGDFCPGETLICCDRERE